MCIRDSCGTTPAHTKACRVLFDRQRRRSRFFGYLTFFVVVLAVLARALGPALALALAEKRVWDEL